MNSVIKARYGYLICVLYATALAAQPQVCRTCKSATDKKALVIGNNMYRMEPLRNAVNDARTMATILEQNGFTVTLATNLDGEHFRAAITRYQSSLTLSTLSVVYYAGHGAQFGGDTLMLPIDVALNRRTSILDSGLRASETLKDVASLSEATVIILDTCRETLQTNVPGLLDVKYQAPNVLLMHSTGPGKPADDSPLKRNGVFVEALLQVLAERQSGWTLTALLNRVQEVVKQSTAGNQVPWLSSSLRSDYWLNQARENSEPESTSASKPKSSALCAVTARTMLIGCDPSRRECGNEEIRARYISIKAREISCSPLKVSEGTDTTIEAQRACVKLGGRIALLDEVLYAAAAAAAGEADWVQSPQERYAERNVLTDKVVSIAPGGGYVVVPAGAVGSVRCAIP